MAHESFEDDETAAVMNDLFVNIKVDREERPDVDAIYMSALHELGEQGGWPLTMFLTSEARAVLGRHLFPQGRALRPPCLYACAEGDRAHLSRRAGQGPAERRRAEDALQRRSPSAARRDRRTTPRSTDLARAFGQLVDPDHGGIRGAPKFPQPQFFTFLWRAGLRYGLRQSDRGA